MGDAEPVKEGDLAGRAFCVSGFLRCPWDNCCGNRRFSENLLSLYRGGGGGTVADSPFENKVA